MAYNVPGGDPGAFTVGNVPAVGEWGVKLNNAIATCVEASSTVLGAIYGLWAPTQATDKQLAQELIAKGSAAPNGATNWAAASAQLSAHGLPNTAYSPDWFTSHQWQPVVNAALQQGKPVLFGFWDQSGSNAPTDTWSGTRPDLGVHGHAVAIVGADSSGYIIADPNSAAANNGGGYVHYTAADLSRVASSMVIPDSPPAGGGQLHTLSFGGASGSGPLGVDLSGLTSWLNGLVTNVTISAVGLICIIIGLFFLIQIGGNNLAGHTVNAARTAAALSTK